MHCWFAAKQKAGTSVAMTAMDEIRFIAASGALGSGEVDADALDEAMLTSPHFIAADAGTADAGPFSLGSGRPAYPREAVKRDLAIMIRAARRAGIPVLVGSCGTAGTDSQVDWVVQIAGEIAAEHQLKFRTAAIYSEQNTGYLATLLEEGRIRPLDPAPHLDADVLKRSTRVVGMMGVEPLQQALRSGADLVLAGRCSDSALFAALPVMKGYSQGLAWHLGKVMECGTLVCETAGKGVILGAIDGDSATLRPFGKGLKCTPQSVAAHSLYENADPYLHVESSGTLDLTESQFEAVPGGVRITGSAFHEASAYTVKLEGAELAGYQTIVVGGVRDPTIIRQLDSWLEGIRRRIDGAAKNVFGADLKTDSYKIVFHVYGRDAVMGALEPQRNNLPHEVGIVLEATAATQAMATKLAELARQPLLHHPVPEWQGSITGFACLHNPAGIERGPVYRFMLNHVAVPETPDEMFRIVFVDSQ
jgi:hypothetical protein